VENRLKTKENFDSVEKFHVVKNRAVGSWKKNFSLMNNPDYPKINLVGMAEIIQ
jgi:hypothetical protein